jgi:UDP:flavonoid glycosyltransferase YjiC (YdhE family)
LALGLKAAGYQVRLATHAAYRDSVVARGIQFAAVEGSPEAILDSDAGRELLASGANPIQLVRGFLHILEPIMGRYFQSTHDACLGSDAIVHTPLAFPAAYAARKWRIPALVAPLQPVTRTHAFPATVVSPRWRRLGRWFNYLTYLAAEQLFWQTFRRRFNDWLRTSLDLPAEGFWGPFGDLARGTTPYIYGFSEHVVPRPPDYGAHVHISGYWFLQRAPSWEPPAALASFLDSGDRPVYIGFGSMADENPHVLTKLVREALDLSDHRAILLAGWGKLHDHDFGPDVIVVNSVPHSWLFPRVAAVVHHGGAGTTAAGLRAGVPAVPVPYFGDQFFWSWRIAALGAGVAPLPRRSLTAARLAAAIIEATEQGAIKAQAANLGSRLRAEDGIGRAIVFIQQELDRWYGGSP